ncbi:MAG TPA: DUF4386 family protein [Candidatus Eisenbacteria bacterium]|jgi:hypothetical protein|nr:DUF4386 family protein [Candidatus Eisenbacteria bacterium]
MKAPEVELVALAEAGHRRESLLRMGGAAAIVGSVIFVAAGIAFGNLTHSSNPETVLRVIASRGRTFWPLVQMGFAFGALLWVIALTALTRTLTDGTSWALSRVAVSAVFLGATIHIIDSSISAYALGTIARDWNMSGADMVRYEAFGEVIQRILGGTWAAVITFFHGVPFILFGLAVALSGRYPKWLGWVGFIGGVGSLLCGIPMFFARYFVSLDFYIPFAVLLSVWMIIIGVHLWTRAEEL